MGPGDEEAKRTQTESSGGAGRHPLPHEDQGAEQSDPNVGEVHDDAARELRERGPSKTRERPSDDTSGG